MRTQAYIVLLIYFCKTKGQKIMKLFRWMVLQWPWQSTLTGLEPRTTDLNFEEFTLFIKGRKKIIWENIIDV